MPNQRITYLAFGDESNWSNQRFRSVALVTGRIRDLDSMECKLQEAIPAHRECKWSNLGSGERANDAKRMIRIVGRYAAARRCRVDTLVWDIQDKRHDVRRRDDVENLGRMYYHLAKKVLRDRWDDDNAVWKLLPDEQGSVQWDTIERCLNAAYKEALQDRNSAESLFPLISGQMPYRQYLNIDEVKQVRSEEWRLTQLADLFAGVSVFSWFKHQNFSSWRQPTLPLLDLEIEGSDASKRDEIRFSVLEEICRVCQSWKFGLSPPDMTHGLQTKKEQATQPINFWKWESQHDLDKAPVKRNSSDKVK